MVDDAINKKKIKLAEICFGGERLTVLDPSHNAVIARGTFGEVSLAFLHAKSDDTTDKPTATTPQICAIKTLQQAWTRQGELTPSAKSEVTALQTLSGHDNILLLHAVAEAAKTNPFGLDLIVTYSPVDLGLVLEWKRRTMAPLLSISSIELLAYDLLQGLAHCHQHGILHRDVKPGNLLLSHETGCLQLCDFGLAYFFHDESINADDDRALGTLYYRPPEVLLGARATHPAVDMYAAGVTVAEWLSTGRPLLTGTNDLSQLQLIFEALGTPTLASWPTVDQLPDWGKLQFTERPPTSWDQLVPRAVEHPRVLQLLQSTVQLDPRARKSAVDCLSTLAPSPIIGGGNGDAYHAPSRRSALVRECIPVELLPPILLGGEPLPQGRVAATAKSRRTFLGSFETWESA